MHLNKATLFFQYFIISSVYYGNYLEFTIISSLTLHFIIYCDCGTEDKLKISKTIYFFQLPLAYIFHFIVKVLTFFYNLRRNAEWIFIFFLSPDFMNEISIEHEI